MVKLTKEEETLLKDYSRSVSTKSSALFYSNAFIISTIPLWLFWRIHQIEPRQLLALFAIFVIPLTFAISYAYQNVKFVLKHKIAQKRHEAVAAEINRTFSDDKKMLKKEKEERILWKKNEVADYEATTFSIFFNNALYLFIVIFCSFYLFSRLSPFANYTFSSGLACAAVALFSTSSR